MQYSTLTVSYVSEAPTLINDRLMAERVSGGFENSTGIAFLGPNDILVIEKDTGAVLRLPEPLANLEVSSADKNYIFLYYTEAKSESEKKSCVLHNIS